MRTVLIAIVYGIAGLATVAFAVRGMMEFGFSEDLAFAIGVGLFFGYVWIGEQITS